MKIDVMIDVLKRNDDTSNKINHYLHSKNIKMYNLLGSPGSGKTSLLEKLLTLYNKEEVLVIEGDLFTEIDAQRIAKLGIKTIQLNTNGACHLESYMIEDALNKINLDKIKYIFIDNIGNLVCTASYNLGEDIRIVVTSVTEGNDKPLKYIKIFKTSNIVVLNKIDLINYCDFDIDEFINNVRSINPEIKILQISARQNQNIEKLFKIL